MSGEKLEAPTGKQWAIGLGAMALLCVIALIVAVSFGMQRSGDSDNEPVTAAQPDPARAAAVPGATPEDLSGIHCGVSFWGKKTLSDADVGRVNFTPQPSTIDALRAFPAPNPLLQTQRSAPVEDTTYTISGEARAAKLEADGDIHLVLANAAGKTIIVELPDAAHCVRSAPELRAQMAAARAAFIARFGAPSTTRFQKLSGVVTVTGVGFFDDVHGQNGVVPSGIELHPLLRCC